MKQKFIKKSRHADLCYKTNFNVNLLTKKAPLLKLTKNMLIGYILPEPSVGSKVF